MAALIPAPNYGTGGIANNFQSNGDLKFNRNSVDLKINYIPSAKTTVFGRYSAEPVTIFNPQQLGPARGATTGNVSVPGNANNLNQVVALGGTYVFNPHVLLDANVSFVRHRAETLNTDIRTNYGLTTLNIPGTNSSNPLDGGYPAFNLSGLSGLGNSSLNSPQVYRNNQYTYAANLSWIKRNHSFRFGISAGRFQLNNYASAIAYSMRGGFTFSGGDTALNGGAPPQVFTRSDVFPLGPATHNEEKCEYHK